MKKTPARNEVAKKTKDQTQKKTVKANAPLDAPEIQKPTVTSEFVPPPPDWLEAEALAEPNYLELGDYRGTISILRGKGFSFREIANWLSDRHVEADHNAVYRVYSKGLTREEQAVLDEREAEEEIFENR